MPSPIAHTTAGFVVYSLLRTRPGFDSLRPVGRIPGLLLLTTGVSLLPDLDSVAGILARDFGKFHNNGTHSFIIGALAAISISGFARWKLRGSFRDWFLVSFICYALHVAMDSATGGRGVMAIWPLSVNRWQTRPSLFYGFHWSDGWLSQRHVWTFVSELVFTICIIVMTRWLHKRLNR